MKTIKAILSVIALSIVFSMQAQDIHVSSKFGAVSMDELKMTSYEADSTASAVYLYAGQDMSITTMKREGRFKAGVYSEVEDYLQYITKNRLRLKILDASALDAATFAITLKNAGRYQDLLKGLKVVTYNLTGGKITSVALAKNQITESVTKGGEKTISFTAPAVCAGSVVELQWETITDEGLEMPDIVMQKDFPIRYGEYRLRIPLPIRYTIAMQGVYTDLCKFAQNSEGDMTVETFTVRDMPGLKAEKACFAPTQHLSQACYTLKGMEFPESFVTKNYTSYKVPARRVTILDTWESIDKQLHSTVNFTLQNYDCKFKKEVDEIIALNLPDEQATKAMRDVVLKNLEWDGAISIMPEPALNIYSAGKGNNADINAAMASCLIRAGYAVCPVFLKLRSSGDINKTDINQYDTFVLFAESPAGGKFVFDTVDQSAYLNSLPTDMRARSFRFVNNSGDGEWVNFDSLSADSQSCVVNARLDADGTFTAKVMLKFLGGNAYDMKTFYHSFNSTEDFIKGLQDQFKGFNIDSCTILSGQDWSNEMSIDLSIRGKADIKDGQMEIHPIIRDFVDASLFTEPSRFCPIEFPHKEDINYSFAMQIPEDFQFGEMPENYNIGSIALGATAHNECTTLGNTFITRFSMKLGKTCVSNQVYQAVSSFWEQLRSTCDEKVVVKRR